MARFLKSRAKVKGAAPGSLIFVGKQNMEKPRIRLITFNGDGCNEQEYEHIEKVFENILPNQISWLNIDGLHDVSLIKKIGLRFDISPLALDNVLNTGQRARYFEDKNSLTLLTKAVYFDSSINRISVEQISFVLIDQMVISFQEKPGDHFEPVRERIRHSVGRVRKSTADYLLYALMDTLVDNYLIDIEEIGSRIEELEPKLSEPNKALSTQLFHFKTEITYFRKTIRPLREVMTRLLRSRTGFLNEDSHAYFLELSELVDHAIDAIDTYFNMVTDQINLYNTNVSNRANDVMKVLTIFASIFIPLTFIAGIYGTNFEYLPELHFKYSYFVMWAVMLSVAVSMLIYFKKNNWF
jgi:magnesium transporter